MQFSATDGIAYFHEDQRFTQKWLWAILIAVSAINIATFGYGIYQQLYLREPFGNNPTSDTSLLAIGFITMTIVILMPVMFRLLRLETEVRRDGVYYRMFPLQIKFRSLPAAAIASFAIRQYSPIGEYGGWGLRYSRKSGRALNVKGNIGMQFVLADGKKILLGTQMPDEFLSAMKKLNITA